MPQLPRAARHWVSPPPLTCSMVNWKHIASYLALLNSPVPSKPQVDDYQRELTLRATRPDRTHLAYSDFIQVSAPN